MDAIELRPNFSLGTSRFASADLYADKRAKLGKNKFTAISGIYDKFLGTLPTVKEAVQTVVEKAEDLYKGVLEKHGLTVYENYLTEGSATGAKKLRVGEIVATASRNFSKAVATVKPKEEVVTKVVEEKPATPPKVEEPKEVPMSRTRLHEDTMPIYSEPTARDVADNISSQRLDSYLANGLDANVAKEQSFDKLAQKLSEIKAIQEKTSDLEAKQSELLAEEEAMDRELAQALDTADRDYLSATQSLDKVIESINDTKGRIEEKRRMLAQLHRVTK